MGVATDQITTLHDQQATRKAIIDSFNAIKSNTLINKGDPILIYFAGHGASTRSPPGWDSISSEVQFVVPFDYGLTIDGVTVSPLPDRTIGVLLDRIAEEKGDNIVSYQQSLRYLLTQLQDRNIRLLSLGFRLP